MHRTLRSVGRTTNERAVERTQLAGVDRSVRQTYRTDLELDPSVAAAHSVQTTSVLHNTKHKRRVVTDSNAEESESEMQSCEFT